MANNAQTTAEWLETLRARGATVSLRNGRICISPKAAYIGLSDDELLTLRHHRAEIKALLAAEGPQPAVRGPSPPEPDDGAPRPPSPNTPSTAMFPPPSPSPPIPADILSVINANTPEEAARRSAEATRLMLARIGKPHPWL